MEADERLMLAVVVGTFAVLLAAAIAVTIDSYFDTQVTRYKRCMEFRIPKNEPLPPLE